MRARFPLSFPRVVRCASPRGVLTAAAALVVLATLVPAQPQFDFFAERALPEDQSDDTNSVALGDIDGDGDLDVIIGNRQQDRLYVNNGIGTYADVTAAQLPVNSDVTNHVELGDVDGDGDLDMVVAIYRGQDRLYLNDGAGTFTDVTAARLPVHTGTATESVLADVDGDGDLDIVLAIFREQNRLYLNDGTGHYSDATSSHMPFHRDFTSALAMGDVDGDGDLDVVFANSYYGQLNRLYLNDGNGSFTDATATQMPNGARDSRAVALSDFDADGDLDLVVGNIGQSRLYLNDGFGTYTDVTAARMPAGNGITISVAVGDVDADGDLDIAFGNQLQDRLYLNDGGATFTDVTATSMPGGGGPLTNAIALGDVDQDGDLDVIIGKDQRNALYYNDGTAVFSDTHAPRLVLARAQAVAVGDVDSDGDPDLVFGVNGQNPLYTGDGAGTFTDVTAARMPPNADRTLSIALGDVDGDQDLDIVAANSSVQSRLYLNDGTGHFTDDTGARLPARSGPTSSVALGDVDGDGDLDMVLGNADSKRNWLYVNDGTGHFADVTATRMPEHGDVTAWVSLGDMDGDGDLDIVFGNQSPPTRLYVNDGTGRFTSGAAMPAGTDGATALALADVDGDGDLDIALATLKQNRLYLNDGAGTFTDTTADRMPSDNDNSLVVVAGDVDDDGDPDLIFGNRNAGVAEPHTFYLNDGTGYFADVTVNRMPAVQNLAEAAALSDFDADGDLDLLMGTHLLFNLRRHLDPPSMPRLGLPYPLEAYARHGLPSLTDTAVLFLSTATASIPLGPLGTFGLDPAQTVTLPSLAIPQPSGVGSITLFMPNVPALAGVSLYGQALLLSPSSPARLTNVMSDVIKR